MVENIRAIISKCGVTHLFAVPHFVLEFIRNASSRKVQLVFLSTYMLF